MDARVETQASGVSGKYRYIHQVRQRLRWDHRAIAFRPRPTAMLP
jgi:hypothetical protein